jgi:hypothetical protein
LFHITNAGAVPLQGFMSLWSYTWMFIKYSMFVTGSYCSQNMFTKVIHTDNFLTCTSNVSLSVANSDLEEGNTMPSSYPSVWPYLWIKILYWSFLFVFLHVFSLNLLQFWKYG